MSDIIIFNRPQRFSERQVISMRQEYVSGCDEHGVGALARRYGVERKTIRKIVTGRTYREVIA